MLGGRASILSFFWLRGFFPPSLYFFPNASPKTHSLFVKSLRRVSTLLDLARSSRTSSLVLSQIYFLRKCQLLTKSQDLIVDHFFGSNQSFEQFDRWIINGVPNSNQASEFPRLQLRLTRRKGLRLVQVHEAVQRFADNGGAEEGQTYQIL